jgi:hypothetical protein
MSLVTKMSVCSLTECIHFAQKVSKLSVFEQLIGSNVNVDEHEIIVLTLFFNAMHCFVIGALGSRH